MRKKILFSIGIFIIGIFLLIGVNAQFDYETPEFLSSTEDFQYFTPSFYSYYSSEDISTYWPILRDIENDQCDAASDFIIMIPPGGCTPGVVRSDLLEEQNVPVFCKLDAIKVNPLIKVSSIESISFKGDYPEDVVGISFHPARAAIRSYETLLGSPLINNIGYVVIILKKHKAEKEMSDWVSGNLTATIYYDAEKAYGTGAGEYYVPIMTDENWSKNYLDYGFWQGKGFIRVDDIEDNRAKVSLYLDKENIFQRIVLEEGKTSELMYFPGFYCKAGLQVKLNDITGPDKEVKLDIDGEELWLRKGSRFLNDRCVVKEIYTLDDGTGSVSISCPGDSFDLMLQKKGALIEVDGYGEEYGLSDVLFSIQNKRIYLGYVGVLPFGEKKNFILLINSNKKPESDELIRISQRISDIFESDGNLNLESFEKKIETVIGKNIYLLVQADENGKATEIEGRNILFKGLADRIKDEDYLQIDEKIKGELIEKYFSKANDSVYELIEKYPYEKERIHRFGEENLWKQIEISELLGKQISERAYLEKFIETYADSSSIEKAKEKLFQISYFDYSQAYASVFVNNGYHYIRVEKFKPVNKDMKNVLVSISGIWERFSEDEKINLDNKDLKEEPGKTDDYIIVESIESNKAKLVYYDYNEDKNRYENPEDLGSGGYLREGDIVRESGKDIVMREINIENIAHISLIPKIDNTKTEANFSFKIGIEKRGIQLSPERTKMMIENLNESIAEWENIRDRLGNFVKGMKGACFLTSSILMIKNTIGKLSGETMARQNVMKTYRDICEKDLAYKGKTRTECYNELAPDINRDVEIYKKAIEEINNDIRDIEEDASKSGFLGFGKVVDEKEVLEKYKKRFAKAITIRAEGQDEEVSLDNITSINQLRDIALLEKLRNSKELTKDVLNDMQDDVDRMLLPVWKNQQRDKEKEEWQMQVPNRLAVSLPLEPGENIIRWDKDSSFSKDELKNITINYQKIDEYHELEGNEKLDLQLVISSGEKYLVVLQPDSRRVSRMVESSIYKVDIIDKKISIKMDGDKAIKVNKFPEPSGVSYVKSSECENYYENPQVRYYETAPNQQLPAIVPFDIENGWYVKVPDTLGGIFSSGEQGYQASGDVSFFYICNVGDDGFEKNMQEDICQSFDINTYANVDSFAGCYLTKQEVKSLAENAREAIRQAAQQYGTKSGYVNIFGQKIEIGNPMQGEGETMECQDFMSPEECVLLFNVCDPVVCPASRCDFGGKYPVANVVQSGIIGSIVLCLPNWREGVKIPVCLTGIHAGLDAYISILKSEQECLKRSLETGEKVGICDEITSVYKCEFFWRQFAPLMRLIIPKTIEWAYGLRGSSQGARGGGEYLTVMHAWDSLQKGVDYFKDVYAQNVFRAFQFRTIEQAGGEFCRMFIGTSFPTSAELLDSLLEPESPTQFHAWFSETLFTDATVPATSHYKVYYHIYAGNDKGVYYSVYLRSPPATSYYAISPELAVKTGYIARGESADEAIDFTAPAGYKELCVVIDRQAECGFGQVSTSFAVDYVQKKYIQDQANRTDIDSEKECISGTPSLWGLINPNIQAGVEQAITPEIGLGGIVRVCATNNPGENVDKDRWVDVGDCGNENIRCWLDIKSVENDLEQLDKLHGTNVIDSLTGKAEDIDKGLILSDISTEEKLAGLRESIEKLEPKLEKSVLGKQSDLDGYISGEIDTIEEELTKLSRIGQEGGMAYSNEQRAEAIALKSEVYRKIIRSLYNLVFIEITKPSEKEEEKETSIGEEIEELEYEPGLEEVGDAKEMVLNAARKLEGKSYGSCWEAMEAIYKEAGVDLPNCVYSVGNIKNPATKLIIDIKKSGWGILNDPGKVDGPIGFCQSNEDRTCPKKRDERDPVDLQLGDLIQFYNAYEKNIWGIDRYGNKIGLGEHNFIFHKWKDENNRIAYGWSQKNSNAGIEYEERILNIVDEDRPVENPITIIWEPVLKKEVCSGKICLIKIFVDNKEREVIDLEKDTEPYLAEYDYTPVDEISVEVVHGCDSIEMREKKGLTSKNTEYIGEKFYIGKIDEIALHKFSVRCLEEEKLKKTAEFSIQILPKGKETLPPLSE